MASSDSRDNSRKDFGASSWQDLGPDAFDEERLLTLEAQIVGTHVVTCREFVVPEDYSLDELHFLLTLLFDWGGSFPYCFQNDEGFFTYPHEDELPEVVRRAKARPLDSTLCTVADFLHDDVEGAYYYDVPEGMWAISVRVLNHLSGADFPYPMLPVCLGGEGNNPPEDVGGPGGYRDLCDDLENEDSRDHLSARMWMGLEDGEAFDPWSFDEMEMNYLLACEQVEAMEDTLVPTDPAELRLLAKDLLAEEAARNTMDILRVARISESLDTPAGRELVNRLLREVFPYEDEPVDPKPRRQAPLDGEPDRSSEFRVVRVAQPPAPSAAVDDGDAAGPGAAAKPAPRPFVATRGADLAAEHEQERVRESSAYLQAFERDLRAARLSEKTIEKHLMNAEYFLNVYLSTRNFSVQEGCRQLDDFFGFFLPFDCMGISLTSMKEHITSVKKLYKCLLGQGVVSAADYAFLEETVATYKDEWLAGF